MDRLFLAYRRALARRDRDKLAQLIRAHPELHDVEGRFGTIVWDIARKAPELLETAFLAGLSPDAGGATFLRGAAADGQAEWVALAIKFGANLESRNERDETPLGYASAWGHLAVVKLLVEAGADINALETEPEDGVAFSALDACSGQHGNVEIAEYLRARGAKRAHEIIGGV